MWIDAAEPDRIRLLRVPEALQVVTDGEPDKAALIDALVSSDSADQHHRAIRYHTQQWHPRSNQRFHGYRRIETLFGGGGVIANLVQTYETPATIAAGSGALLLASARTLPGGDPDLAGRIETRILRRLALADGLSTYLSDAYRGGMVTNFLFSAVAIIGGVAYLPFAGADSKWPSRCSSSCSSSRSSPSSWSGETAAGTGAGSKRAALRNICATRRSW